MVTTTVAETDLHRVLSSSVGWGTCDCNRLGVMISDSVIYVVYVIYVYNYARIWHLQFGHFAYKTVLHQTISATIMTALRDATNYHRMYRV